MFGDLKRQQDQELELKEKAAAEKKKEEGEDEEEKKETDEKLEGIELNTTKIFTRGDLLSYLK